MSGIGDLEARLLASVPTADAFLELERRGITAESFQIYRPMYAYIADLVEEHGHLPRLRDLKATFQVPDHVKRQPEEYDWLLSEFLKLTTAQKVQGILEANVDAYSDDPHLLVGGVIRDLSELQVQDRREVSVTDAGTSERLEKYQERAGDRGRLVGIPTGLSYFDANCRLGWMPGELVGVIARTFLGKSWLLIHFGLIAWQHGKRVLFLSPELPKDEAEARWDTLLCGMNGVAVDAMDFYRGLLPTKEQVELAKRSSGRRDWITLTGIEGKPFTLSEIPRLVQRHEPDIVLIDGISFLKLGGRAKQPWEMIYELSYGLKSVAVGHGAVIVVTHQANRGAHDTGKPPGLHEIFGGDALAQACDRVVVISRPKREPKQMVVTIQKFRKGEPQQGGIKLHFDPGKGKIDEIINTGTARKSRSSRSSVQGGKGASDTLPIP